MNIKFEIKGKDVMQRAMRLLEDRGPKAMGAALWKEGNAVMTNAKAITPVDTGALKGSGVVNLPEIINNEVSVSLAFGGAASNYAVYVHEDPKARHNPPTQYKFLEQPLLEAANGMGQRIAQELWAQLK